MVKFMSSWDNDFMSWPKHHQLLFGGQSVELPLSLYCFPWLPPGSYQGLSMWQIWVKIHSLLMFEGLWWPLVSKVTGIGSPTEVRSWDPRVLWCHAHSRCYPANTVRDSLLKLEKCQILGYGWGGAAPYDPINPYLGETCENNEPLFTCLFIYAHFGNLSLELNMVPGSS